MKIKLENLLYLGKNIILDRTQIHDYIGHSFAEILNNLCINRDDVVYILNDCNKYIPDLNPIQSHKFIMCFLIPSKWNLPTDTVVIITDNKGYLVKC